MSSANSRATWATKALSGAALAATLLSGCASQPGLSGLDKQPSTQSTPTKFSGADIMFAQMMIPHHQQAVDMGTLAETRAASPEVKALAAQIKSEQAPEIAQMKRWLMSAGATLDMGHRMGMGGMLTTQDMQDLAAASGAKFDKLFLAGMIGHHEGAVHMAQMVLDSNNSEAKALGNTIVATQTKQIKYMQKLLQK